MSDAWDSLILRHQLTFAEATRIRDEVGAGRAFTEPHMRAAAAEWAQHRLDTASLAHMWASPWRRRVFVAALIAFVVELAWRLSTLQPGRVPVGLWLGPALLALNLSPVWIGRRLLRATITRNQGPLEGADDTRPGDTRP